MKRTSSWVVGIVVVLLLSGNVLAQELATLKVTVNDQTGAVIPGAAITLKNTATEAKRTDVTESHGLSVIPGLPPGSYELTAEAKGFTARELPLSLSVGQTASLVVTLGVTVLQQVQVQDDTQRDRKSTRLNSSHEWISYAVFCLKKKKIEKRE